MEELKQLYDLIINSAASREQEQRFLTLLTLLENETIAKELLHEYALYAEKDETIKGLTPERLMMIEESILFASQKQKNTIAPVHHIHFLKTAWFRYAAAIIILFGVGAYLWNILSTSGSEITKNKPVPVAHDIMPGGNKAMLTLADGQQIMLDSAINGSLVIENGSAVTKQNGAIIYDARQADNSVISYNTMSTPPGGQYQLILADGTRIWLNAMSSITYPTAFINKTREVKITGEAYFEVKPDAVKPFIVHTSKENITVLGTSFNVNSYADERFNKTSLLDGVIKVGERLLKPGQAFSNGKISPTNIQQDIAWKNGLFNFEGAGLGQVMQQLERWYDIRVQYEGVEPDIEFHGKMYRDVPLSEVLKMLQKAGVLFKVEGRAIIIQ